MGNIRERLMTRMLSPVGVSGTTRLGRQLQRLVCIAFLLGLLPLHADELVYLSDLAVVQDTGGYNFVDVTDSLTAGDSITWVQGKINNDNAHMVSISVSFTLNGETIVSPWSYNILAGGTITVSAVINPPIVLSAGDYVLRFIDSEDVGLTRNFTVSEAGVANRPPDTPILSSPVNGSIGVIVTPTLQASAFYDPDGDSHANSHWQVDTDDNFGSPVWESGESYTAGTSATVPPDLLNGGTTYYWRVRYKDNRDAWSAWSFHWSFTTEAFPITMHKPEIGPDGKAVIRWNSEVGRTYSLLYSEDLLTGFEVLQSGILATPPVNAFEDDISGGKQRFWKVKQE